jgi:nitroreductase
MDAIELLTQRTSTPALEAPAPTPKQLQVMFESAARAPDHGLLRPYRFLTIQGNGLDRLGELYLKAALAKGGELDDASRNRFLNMPRRAPMIVVAIAVVQSHPKVPEIEQIITAGCAAQAVVQAAYAQGLGAVWRSGDLMFDPIVEQGLGLLDHEKMVGFIYLGQPMRSREAPVANIELFTAEWKGE